jgi:23S rRNA (pseudouridine1915-N3)-methyltransferase
MKTTILAVGKLRGPEADLCEEYLKRLSGAVTVREITAGRLTDSAAHKMETALLLKAIPAKAFAVVLDERGKDLSSRELAIRLQTWQEQGRELVFAIGGAGGVTDEIRARGDFMLGLGRATWPHRLARVMLLEQLYRARQINAGHPYHRD